MRDASAVGRLARTRTIPPAAILASGWLVMLLYAFPGYMSFDSIAQLAQSRSNELLDNHPPAMAVLWQYVEVFIEGPLGMLLLQSSALLAGVYLLLATRTTKRRAAVLAVAVMWFPPVLNTMSVIWKDSQMAGYLMLGTALLLSSRRGLRLGGLALIMLATAMRYNALAMTFPIVVLLFSWNPLHRWWKRYAISIAAWFALTIGSSMGSSALADHHAYMWHGSLALLDLTGTLRFSEPMTDAQLGPTLAGTPLKVPDHFQDHAKAHLDPRASPTDDLWNATAALFDRSVTADPKMRLAITRAWKTIVTAHPLAYLRYRLVVFGQLVQLDGTALGSPIYCWFTDVQQPFESGARIGHLASPSYFQGVAQQVMIWSGETWLFHVGLYLILAVLLLPMCWGDREALAMVASGLSGQLGLFVISPTVDVRYSFWLMLATVAGAILIALRRIRSRGSSRIPQSTLLPDTQ